MTSNSKNHHFIENYNFYMQNEIFVQILIKIIVIKINNKNL